MGKLRNGSYLAYLVLKVLLGRGDKLENFDLIFSTLLKHLWAY